MCMFRKLMNDDSGATAIEYGLIAALVSVAAITGFKAVGTKLSAVMVSVSTSLQ